MSGIYDELSEKFDGIALQEIAEMCVHGGISVWKFSLKELFEKCPERCPECNHISGHFLLRGASGGIELVYTLNCSNCSYKIDI